MQELVTWKLILTKKDYSFWLKSFQLFHISSDYSKYWKSWNRESLFDDEDDRNQTDKHWVWELTTKIKMREMMTIVKIYLSRFLEDCFVFVYLL